MCLFSLYTSKRIASNWAPHQSESLPAGCVLAVGCITAHKHHNFNRIKPDKGQTKASKWTLDTFPTADFCCLDSFISSLCTLTCWFWGQKPDAEDFSCQRLHLRLWFLTVPQVHDGRDFSTCNVSAKFGQENRRKRRHDIHLYRFAFLDDVTGDYKGVSRFPSSSSVKQAEQTRLHFRWTDETVAWLGPLILLTLKLG